MIASNKKRTHQDTRSVETKSDNTKVILIQKASGEEEPFILDKLARSLRKAGADSKSIEKILIDIEEWVYTGVTTKQIYSRAFSLLRREKKSFAMRYRLKQAIIELGPTGYPFEQFIGQLFKKQGYKIEVGVVVDGYCVTHEMDVIATQDHMQHLVECKYHKDQGKHVSVQVPLYVRSRVNDIIDKRKEIPKYSELSFEGWIVTNTRFSEDSIKYGTCSGLNLLAWDYPHDKGLKEIVEDLRLYPVTILHHLTKKKKQELLNKGIVTCFQLKEDLNALNSILLNDRKQKLIKEELFEICG
ncbi:MAG: restriction endonuclease [Labilibaculum sp.]|nr:restriction endonuclease [Labilibaculum sp.]MBI9059317.1 restriction endonuclease [Labilibaculum sp.]